MTNSYELSGKRVYVAGHRGMVGSALVRRLQKEKCEIICVDRADVDLRRQDDTEQWLKKTRPQAVFLAAATVGGIVANDSRPADFIHDNLAIQTNVIEGSRQIGVEKLMALGSSCIYPKLAFQPMKEEVLLTGPPDETNQWYAIAKIAGLKLCQAYRRQYGCDFISVMPANLYGPNDNFDLTSSHVIPALLAKAHNSKLTSKSSFELWGTGSPRREFLHVDDLADACTFLMKNYSAESHINIGTGVDVSIRELAEIICSVVGFSGDLTFDKSKPDGAPRKLLDVSRLNDLGWKAKTELVSGLESTYRWFLSNIDHLRGSHGR